MKHEIVIETRYRERGDYFRADVVEGPPWAVGMVDAAESASEVYRAMCETVKAHASRRDTFSFIHAEM